MPIMAKSNDEYTEVKAIKTPDGTEIDYVLSKVDNTYKRTYTAIRELEDTPPLEFKSIKPNANLIDYRIYGQTSRNLFDEIYTDITTTMATHVRTLTVPNGEYTLSTTTPIAEGSSAANLFLCTTEDPTPSTTYNGVYAGHSKTVTVNDGQLFIFYRAPNTDPRDYHTMLNSGTEPLPYEPYGESVGDRTGNLFDKNATNTENGFVDNAYLNGSTGEQVTNESWIISEYIDVEPNTRYCYSNSYIGSSPALCEYSENNTLLIVNKYLGGTSFTFTSSANTKKIRLSIRKDYINAAMLNSGSTALPYEPYGYRVPVTVSNGTDTLTTPIYLPEQIRKVGDEAEYIDFNQQKQHRVRVNLSEVNEFSNSITDTANSLYIWVQQGKNDSFVYPAQSRIFVITEPTTITTNITITDDNDSIRIKHNGSTRDIVIDIVRGLSPGVYSVSFNILNYDHATIGGVVINNIMVNKGSAALPYEPYITNTELDVTLPALPTVTGTNVLSVGTEVQPSDMYIKGNFKMIAGGGE